MSTQTQAEKLTTEIAKVVVQQVDSRYKDTIELAEKFKEAAKALDEGTDEIKESWSKWLSESRNYLQDMMTWRMAMVREYKDGMRACQDMNEFLAAPDTKERLKTLKDFVEVAERFKALKESGFLDAMTDTMIKMKP